MHVLLYVIYDRLAESCGPIFQAPTDAVAVRQMRQMFKSPDFSGSPDEFWLYCVGSLNSKDPSIDALPRARRVENVEEKVV